MKKKVIVMIQNHFDLMWRRCFDRDFEFNHQNYISYADLEAFYIIDNVELCDKYPFFKFHIEAVSVLRKFLEKYPEYEERIKELFDEGRIFVSLAGDNITDPNMVQGESLVRNFLYGQHYLKDKYNFTPKGLDRSDSFGNSAQLPQIARNFGTKWCFAITYTDLDNEYWRGLDGSTLYNYKFTGVGGQSCYYKYAPCPACNGYKTEDCPVCNNRRIDIKKMDDSRRPFGFNKELADKVKIPGMVRIWGEETLPLENVITWYHKYKDEYDIEFGYYGTYEDYIQDKLDVVDTVGEDKIHSSAEINANNTGTYVSRIKTKQRVRISENLIALVETLGVMKGISGLGFNTEHVKKMWEKLHYTMFHDAITATHIDAAYYELMDVHNSLENGLKFSLKQLADKLTIKNNDTVTVLNTLGIDTVCTSSVTLNTTDNVTLCDEDGQKVSIISKKIINDTTVIKFVAGYIKAFENKKFKIVSDVEKSSEIYLTENTDKGNDEAGMLTNVVSDTNILQDGKIVTIENEFYKVIASTNGIKEIYDKSLNKTISKQSQYYVGELVLEHDEGSPWATLSPDMRRQPLSVNTALTSVEINDDYQEIVFTVKIPDLCAYAVNSFNSKYSVRLQKGENKVLFSNDIFWDTQNYRLRIAFPSTTTGKHIYEIPYGHIERKPYEPNIVFQDGSSNWAGAAGDWPAINWAGIQGDEFSIALLNKGTPSYQINTDENDVENIYLSVLRSPSVGTYLHDPGKGYSMTDYDGMRDAGNHSFNYALTSYATGFDKNNVVGDAISYNSPIPAFCGNLIDAKLPAIISDDVRISAIKHSEKGNMLVLRLAEYHGINSSATLIIPDSLKIKKAYEMNMNEDILSELTIVDNQIKIDVNKFKIKTIALEL